MLVFLLFPVAVNAIKWFQWPSAVRGDPLQTVLEAPDDESRPYRVAIIGAGAAGSSAAYWLQLASERLEKPIEVDVYERVDYIGGRSTVVYPYDNKTLVPIELGASIYTTDSNKNMMRATKEFGLELYPFSDDEETMGIWDGSQFIVSLTGKNRFGRWWDTFKMLWRYGYRSPTTTVALVKQLVTSFVTLYTTTKGWSSVEEVSKMLEFSDLTVQDTASYLLAQGVSANYAFDVVEAATRVNYGHDLEKIHAVEGLVSMAANGASSAVGGNYQVFEGFLKGSKAHIHLNTTITSLNKTPKGLWVLNTSSGPLSRKFDSIILAAPYDYANIILPQTAITPKPSPYVHLHVTLLATTSPTPNPAYFNMPAGQTPPSMILTTSQGSRAGGPPPEFNSLNYLKKLDHGNGEDEWVAKIFSKKRLSDEWLNNVFQGSVGWVLRKEWDAYPELPPTSEFAPMELDEGLFYVNGFERFISTMETETIASRGIVDLLLKKSFGQGICPEGYESSPPEGSEYVWGWDC